MKKILLLLTLSLLSPFDSVAESINVEVKGMICESCVKKLEEKLKKRFPQINAVSADLASGRVTIQTRPNETITDEVLTTVLENSDYKVKFIHRE